MRDYFAQARRAGFDIGLSAGTLTPAMVEVLLQLPPEVIWRSVNRTGNVGERMT